MALATFNSLSRTRLRAVARAVAMLLAVATGVRVRALLLAVTGTVADLLADHALDFGTARRLLALFFTALASVAQLCDGLS